MLIDEMIKYISEYITNSEVSERIIVALKAGKDMRASLQRVIEHPANNIVAYGSCDKLDEATKDEVLTLMRHLQIGKNNS